MITERSTPIFARGTQAASILASLMLAGLICPEPILAQDDPTTVDLGDCLDIELEADRRACIDAQVAEFLEDRAAGAAETRTSTAEPDDADQDRRAAEEERTERQPAARNLSPRPESDEAASDVQEYFGTIVSLKERLPSAYIITLDNGQVWEQTEPKRYPLRPGLEVRIYSTRWGSRYRLTGLGSGGNIQVRRLR